MEAEQSAAGEPIQPSKKNEEVEPSSEPASDLPKPGMEVHHHPDLHHKKKRFKEYFLEFLMIFLAVTLGFLAENLREHITEKERSHIFAKSLAEDFKADTATLHLAMTYTKEKIDHIDSLEYYLHAPKSHVNDSLVYATVVYIISTFQFDNINGTYEQTKNSGSLRFFDQALVNQMNAYDAAAGKLKLMEDWENKFLYEKVFDMTKQIFNYKVFDDFRKGGSIHHDMYMKNLNQQTIDELINDGEIIKHLRERQQVQQQTLVKSATNILVSLEKDFHLSE